MKPEHNEYYDQKTLFITGFAGCTDKNTEYLTKSGWKTIDTYTYGEEIAIARSTKGINYISWELPKAYISNPGKHKAYKVFDTTNRSNISMVLTPEHNVPYCTAKGVKQTKTIKQLVKELDAVTITRGKKRSPAKIQTGFTLLDKTKVNLTDTEIRLLIAIQADGSIKNNQVRFNLKKPRKIKRLHILLTKLDISYTAPSYKDGYTRFFFSDQFTHLYLKDLTILYQVSLDQALIVTEEAPLWDGSFEPRTGQPLYSCTIKTNTDVIQYCYSIATKSQVSISIDDRRGRIVKGYETTCIGYSANTTIKANTTFTDTMISEIQIEGSYCFTTSTGEWLARHNDFIFITGNSGKSTKIVDIVDDNTLVLVPTHKAAQVLIDKEVKNVYTIHSVLKLVPSINENFKKKMTTRLKQLGSTDLSKIKKVVIDEFSMINEEILNTLMATLPEKADVYIVGDPYQLSPVTGEPIQPWEPIAELTTQYRSKNDDGTEMFMQFMYSIRDYARSPEYNFTPTEDWIQRFNPETDRILAFTNKKVVELNTMVGGTTTFNIGDELTMNGLPVTLSNSDYNQRIYPTCIAKGALMVDNKLEKASQTATRDIDKWNTQCREVPKISY